MRLIDADKANVDYIHCFYGSECRLDDVQEWLDDQPTVNPYQWISVKDRLPELYINVLVYDKLDGIIIAYYSNKGFYSIDEDLLSYVTHWMPLPQTAHQ